MRTFSLVLGACCFALSLATPLSGAIAAKKEAKKAEQPMFCVIAKKPDCNVLCNKLNKCGSGCIEWGKCATAQKGRTKKL